MTCCSQDGCGGVLPTIPIDRAERGQEQSLTKSSRELPPEMGGRDAPRNMDAADRFPADAGAQRASGAGKFPILRHSLRSDHQRHGGHAQRVLQPMDKSKKVSHTPCRGELS